MGAAITTAYIPSVIRMTSERVGEETSDRMRKARVRTDGVSSSRRPIQSVIEHDRPSIVRMVALCSSQRPGILMKVLLLEVASLQLAILKPWSCEVAMIQDRRMPYHDRVQRISFVLATSSVVGLHQTICEKFVEALHSGTSSPLFARIRRHSKWLGS